MPVQSAYQEEKKRLTGVLAEIRRQLEAIGPRYTGDDFTEQMLDVQRGKRIERLETAYREPYFGRLDFQEASSDRPVPLYIGKSGVSGPGRDELLVIDWRAPVASMFYSFAGGDGPASYESPEGEVTGTVHLKRNLVIRGGELIRMADSYTRGQDEALVTDEFLLYRLGENKDNKLRDIVSTIQAEQDRIIRADKNKVLFIQGVAGSGKTTVALHRLAFLLYRYADRVRASRMIIFAPNRMFLDYISGVLPELGVGDIRQTTFEDWTIELLRNEVRAADPADTLYDWFERPRSAADLDSASGRWKGSRAFVALVEERLREIEASFVPQEPFEPVEGVRLQPETMRQWAETDYGAEPIMRKRERLVNRLRRWLETELKDRKWTDRSIRSKALSRLNAFVKKMPSYSAPQAYRTMFEGKRAAAIPDKRIVTETVARLKKGIAAEEDLAPLAYIHIRLYGLDQPPFDHIVIDEAQDYSPFRIEALKLCQRRPSMTVLGDLQQGIHGYAGVRSWREQMELFDDEDVQYYELDRSYRSTMEIIEFANRVLAGMDGGVRPAVPVFRSGEPVEIERTEPENWLAAVEESVRSWQAEGRYKTIVVIGRTARECALLYERLAAGGLYAALVESSQPSYGGGLTVVPVYLSKGLEFDAVVMADAGEAAYGDADAKLLYVGCTRALHRLKLLYRGRLTRLVSGG
ncbi:ATP-binding domain-containing protein [Paenibacillus cisolokensis]|uniref:HelD family protein n=1 Tax=Paenibacillus cisolokensis TaxID=1658519 RepID=UPI003D27006A